MNSMEHDSINMTYSTVLNKNGSCTVCVRFERNDGNDFAEALLPDVSIMKQKGFSPDEIDQLELYLKLNKKDILQKSKDISGITHMFG